MSDTSTIPGGLPPPPPNTYNPIMHSAVVPGNAVCASAADNDTAVLGNNTGPTTRQCLGIVVQGNSAGQRAPVRYAGPVTLTTEEWDAVAGTTGGLARNVWYYLSAATAGHITAAASANVAVGYAISPTTLFVALNQAPPTS